MYNKNLDFSTMPNYDLEDLSLDEKFMLRALQIAKNGLGQTAPNPMVGSVLVHNGKIIGEGFTSAFGGAHAEVNAVASVKDKTLLTSSTLYVTLEPCAHHGKTPPCSDMIIAHNIPKVVIGLMDPHDKVAGQGIAKLRDAGCQVTVGVLADACKEHHKRFLTYINKKRPYIILKWAESADGFIAPEQSIRGKDKKPFWITNTLSRQLVHKWRSEEPGILVGTHTVLADNPKLNIRDWSGKPPTRIILDRNLKISGKFNVLDGSQTTIIVTEKTDEGQYLKGLNYRLIDFKKNVPQQLCSILYQEQIQSILIEGGAKTLESFIDLDLWDEARIFTGTSIFKTGLKAPKLTGNIYFQNFIIKDQLTLLRND